MIKIKAKKGGVEVEYESDKDLYVEYQQKVIKQVVDSVVQIYREEYDKKENNQQN